MKLSRDWHHDHVDLYEGTVIILIATVVFSGFASYRYLRTGEPEVAVYAPPQAAYDEKTLVQSQDEIIDRLLQPAQTYPRDLQRRHSVMSSFLNFILSRWGPLKSR